MGVSALLRDNPVVETAVGPRYSDRGDFLDADLGVSQTFELGGRRSARVAGAEAGVTRAVAGSEDAARRLLRDVAVAFLRTIHAEEELRLASEAEGVATEIASAAERRHQAGEVARLDVNVARAALARVRSGIRAAEAAKTATRGELRMLLDMGTDEPLSIRGDLGDRRRFAIDELLARAPDRPDLRALSAEIHEAEAERRLGEGRAWPDVGLGMRYQRDEGADVVLGGVSLTLPIFERGQGQRAEASARARRLELDLEAGRRLVGIEVRTAFDVYQQRVEAVTELEREALPLLDDNENLSRRSYEAGQIGLLEVLLVRRELLEIRALYLDRLLEAAAAGVELEASAGVLQ
jgi:cobalt-zinc-cadmium efflux system outer membrane protein